MTRRTKGEGSLFKVPGSDFWYVQYREENGRTRRLSTGTTGKKAAEAFRAARIRERDEGLTPLSDLRRLTYADIRKLLIEDYENEKHRSLIKRNGEMTLGHLPALDRFFNYPRTPGPQIIRINPRTAKAFIAARKQEGVGNAAINRSLAALRRMLALAKENGMISVIPKLKGLPEPAPRKGFIEQAQFDELLALLPSHLRPLVAVCYYTGVRSGEAKQIQWSQVDLNEGIIEVTKEQAKNKDGRTLPIDTRLAVLLDAVEPKCGLAFPAVNLRKEWERACVACGQGKIEKLKGESGWSYTHYEGLQLHDLRRSAVRSFIRSGVTETTSMAISGHKTRNVFDRYNISSTDDIREAGRKREAASLNHKVIDKVIVGRVPSPVRGLTS